MPRSTPSWEAIEIITERMGAMVPEGREDQWRRQMAASSGLGLLVGSFDEVADRLAAFAEAGFAGAAMGLVNFLDEVPYIRDEIIPRLEARGARRPVARARSCDASSVSASSRSWSAHARRSA